MGRPDAGFSSFRGPVEPPWRGMCRELGPVQTLRALESQLEVCERNATDDGRPWLIVGYEHAAGYVRAQILEFVDEQAALC